MLSNAKIAYLTSAKRRHQIQSRKHCNELFAMAELSVLVQQSSDISGERILEPGTFIPENDLIFSKGVNVNLDYYQENYVLTFIGNYRGAITIQGNQLGCLILSRKDEAPYALYDSFFLTSEHIDNYDKEGEFTTIGKWIANQFVLVDACQNAISYINKEWDIEKIENTIALLIRDGKLSVQQGGKYLDNMFFLSSVFGSIAVPVFTEKALVPNQKILDRREELYKKYHDKLDDPTIMSMIEQELISMDKEYLKDDDSFGFFGDSGKKFNVHRKRQYLVGGMVESFENTKGNYDFIPKSLAEGWDLDSFVVLANEIRRGSYDRGIETAKGGVVTKYMLRLFQNSKITAEDCGTSHAIVIDIDESNYKEFIGRYIFTDEKSVNMIVLKEENKDNFIGKRVRMRSPMTCEQKDGYCFRCVGDLFRSLDLKAIGALPLELGAAFLTLSMKSMHGTAMKTYKITDLNEFVI